MFKRFLAILATALVPMFVAGTATAATVDIGGGLTRIVVQADLAGLGLTPSVTGTASASVNRNGRLVLDFPISGGSISDDGALIEHDGVGVTLTAGSVSASIGNFLIDTASAGIFGTVGDGDTFVRLFDLRGANGNGRIPVLFNENLANVLTGVFGAPDLTGARFGLARTNPEVVPLPASALLLLGGLGGLVAMRRRKAA